MNAPISRRARIEAVVASTIGTTIEWYDFFLYGTAAALVFPALFFPKSDEFTGRILAFGTFSIGFVARPFGGVVFGAMGDRVGRKAALVATLLLMGISTLLIGFLPTYADIGILAPIALTTLRFLQGLGVGGEWGGAVLMALEYSDKRSRGFTASWPQAGVPLGLLASTGVVMLCRSSMSEADFLSWGWRIPFYLSGVLIAVGLLIRFRIFESPLFAELKKENRLADAPVAEAMRSHWREIVLIAGARLAENASFYLFTASSIAYAKDVLKMDESIFLRAVNVAAVVAFFAMPFFGWLSDRWSRRGAYKLGCALMALFAWAFYYLLNLREPAAVYLAIIVGVGGIHALLYSVQAAMIPELFGTRIRCTGASVAYQLAGPLAGGLAPLIAAVLIQRFPDNYWPLSTYLMGLACISWLSVHFLAETGKRELTES